MGTGPPGTPGEPAAELASLEDRFGADIAHILARAQQIELAAAPV